MSSRKEQYKKMANTKSKQGKKDVPQEQLLAQMIQELEWCTLDPRGIILNPEHSPTYEEMTEFILPFKLVKESMPFIIGDWIVFGEDKFGQKFSQALTIFGDYEAGTLMNYASTMRRVPFEYRTMASFSHHTAVAPLRTEDGEPDYPLMKEMLTSALEQGLNVGQLQAEVKAVMQERDLIPEDTPSKSFHRKAEKAISLIADMVNQIDDPDSKTALIEAQETIKIVQARYDTTAVQKAKERKVKPEKAQKDEPVAEAIMAVLDPKGI